MYERKKLELNGHHSGICVPVSALRSSEDCGIGEFLDLPGFAAWAKSAGFDLIQILPVNDTGSNSSPYSAVSACALHPIYIRLQELPGAAAFSDEIQAFQARVQDRERVSFEPILDFKLGVLRRLFDGWDAEDPTVGTWISSNSWIKPYAVYKCLKQRHEEKSWTEWTAYRDPSREEVDRLWVEFGSDAMFHAWLQFHLDRQFAFAVTQMEANGSFLKGDIPILMSVDSADVWSVRDGFNLDYRAGAPPDMFATLGQMWGFPIYDWDILAEQQYRWWKTRLHQASRYYHAFRIDHVLGFFRIWSVPASENTAVLGRYRPCIPLTTSDLEDCTDDDSPLHRLTEAWTTTQTIQERFGERADHLANRYFEQVAGGDQLLKQNFAAESVLEQLDEADDVKEFLVAIHRDRTFVDGDANGFSPAWFWEESSGFTAAGGDIQSCIVRLVERHEEQSNPVWMQLGRRLLQVIKDSTSMLPCAEDLGVVPSGLREVLSELNILSLKIERWEKDDDDKLITPEAFPYLSVSTPGVHDTSALRAWWEEEDWDREGFCGELRLDECPEWLTPDTARAILVRSLRSGSAIRVVQIQDLFALTLDLRMPLPSDERINIPGSTSDHNWSYRLPIPVEALPEHDITSTLQALWASVADDSRQVTTDEEGL